jgi:hypothetical protein
MQPRISRCWCSTCLPSLPSGDQDQTGADAAEQQRGADAAQRIGETCCVAQCRCIGQERRHQCDSGEGDPAVDRHHGVQQPGAFPLGADVAAGGYGDCWRGGQTKCRDKDGRTGTESPEGEDREHQQAGCQGDPDSGQQTVQAVPSTGAWHQITEFEQDQTKREVNQQLCRVYVERRDPVQATLADQQSKDDIARRARQGKEAS